MEKNVKKGVKKYGSVMPRVYNSSRSSIKTGAGVSQRKLPVKNLGGKSLSNSKVHSGVYSDLPVVLDGYIPDSPDKKLVRQTVVVKPKRTIKSLEPEKVLFPTAYRKFDNTSHNIRVSDSAPSVLEGDVIEWSNYHIRQCFSSRSHIKLKELKEEIRAFQENQKVISLKNRLYKNCGIALNDFGQVSTDKAVQADNENGK